jgi:prevent-host-death family protein
MESVKASYFKNHFGAVLDRVSERAVRIERRGRAPAILLSESEYRAMRARKLTTLEQRNSMARLRKLASGEPVALDSLAEDPRAAAILEKHSKHLES